MKHWPLQEAKAHLADLLRQTRQGGQTVTVRGVPAVVVLSAEEYAALGKTKPSRTFVKFMRSSPLRGVDLKIERDRDPGRKVSL